MDYSDILSRQRAFFLTGQTKSPAFREEALDRLRQSLHTYEEELLDALQQDLGKPHVESYMTELGLIYDELSHARRNLRRWSRDRRLPTAFTVFPARCRMYSEPYGSVLIMAPWNYPLLLCLEPLVGALAAGNCAVVKPSELAPATAQAVERLLRSCFPPEYVDVVLGGKEESGQLLEQPFDFIFYTGGEAVGKVVMTAAARHLTPVCLELGGKSPCIVDETADLALAARRIACGKLINAGQTCVAPDYLFVHQSVRDALVKEIIVCLETFLGDAPLDNPDYPSIINDRHTQRLLSLMDRGTVLCGGGHRGRRIEPTLFADVSPDDPIMQEEIFGPLLPVFTYQDLDEVIRFVNDRPKPLALYFFSRDKRAQRRVIGSISFGGGCINDTLMHVASHHMPFGGVGASGMGRYHGKYSFDLFSHQKAVMHQATWLDLPMRYHPYQASTLDAMRKILK